MPTLIETAAGYLVLGLGEFVVLLILARVFGWKLPKWARWLQRVIRRDPNRIERVIAAWG